MLCVSFMLSKLLRRLLVYPSLNMKPGVNSFSVCFPYDMQQHSEALLVKK